jgi:hypothetical protein
MDTAPFENGRHFITEELVVCSSGEADRRGHDQGRED